MKASIFLRIIFTIVLAGVLVIVSGCKENDLHTEVSSEKIDLAVDSNGEEDDSEVDSKNADEALLSEELEERVNDRAEEIVQQDKGGQSEESSSDGDSIAEDGLDRYLESLSP